MKNPWNQSPQNWNAYGLSWEFTYDELTAKRTITAPGFKLDIKVSDTTKFPSPHLWLEAWAKKNKKRLPSQNSETVTGELELFPSPKLPPERRLQAPESSSGDITSSVQAEVVNEELTEKEELTYDEQRDRLFLERKVEKAFYEAGVALQELRDRRLYKSTHKTFEEYCRERFGFGRHAANHLIAGAGVVQNLVTIGYQNQSEEMGTIGSQILPTSERQVRPLVKLEPEQQREAWSKAVEYAGGKIPSGRIVKDIVQRIKERTQEAVPNPYNIGDICRIIASDDPELKGKGRQWCIVSEVHEFSCTVKIYQGEMTILLDNLRLIDYSTADCEALAQLRERLYHLYSQELEETARAVLDLFGKLDRPDLTPLEEKLLAVLEAQ